MPRQPSNVKTTAQNIKVNSQTYLLHITNPPKAVSRIQLSAAAQLADINRIGYKLSKLT